jgi:microcompartment protein CcmL/EutN
MKHPALGMIEFKSVARGIFVTDVIVKKAPITILKTHATCPGKYMLLFAGEVGDVEEALEAGVKASGDLMIHKLFLPYVHRSIVPAIIGTNTIQNYKTIGVVETFSLASCVVAADLAAKATPVEIVELRLAQGLGGKGYFVMTGEQSDVEASLEVAKKHVAAEGMLADAVMIENPHSEVIEKAIYW